jgi:hypothetical protein
MLHRLGSGNASKRKVWKVTHTNYRLTPPPLDVGWRCTVQRSYAEAISLAKFKITELGLAEARHISQQCIESGLQVTE